RSNSAPVSRSPGCKGGILGIAAMVVVLGATLAIQLTISCAAAQPASADDSRSWLQSKAACGRAAGAGPQAAFGGPCRFDYFNSVIFRTAGILPLLYVPTQMSYCPDCGFSNRNSGFRFPPLSSSATHLPSGRFTSKVVSPSASTWMVRAYCPAV